MLFFLFCGIYCGQKVNISAFQDSFSNDFLHCYILFYNFDIETYVLYYCGTVYY